MKLRDRFISITVMVFVGLLFFSCAKQPLPVLRIGTVVWPGYECLYLARDLGYYKDTSIRLVDHSATSEMARAFRNGELEAATLTIPEAFSLKTAEPIQAVLVTDISNGGDVIVAKPEIKNLKALKGRRVGMEASSVLGAYMLTRALEQVIDPSSLLSDQLVKNLK